jgi:lipoprotein-releasing system permease protein
VTLNVEGTAVASWPGLTAFRYTRSGAGDGLVSSITALSLFGLILGVAVLVLVLSVLNGFERELRERVLSVVPHAVLTSGTPFADWQETSVRVTGHPDVVGVAPVEELSGLAVFAGELAGIQVSGVLPERESQVSQIPDFMLEGEFGDLNSEDYGAILGVELARTLGLSVGERFTVILPTVLMTLAGPQPRTRRFIVVGIFSVGSDADKNQMFIHLNDALKLARKQGVDSLRLSVSNLFDASRVLTEVAQSMPGGQWFGSSWLRRHGNLYGAIQTQKTTLFLLLLMLIAVAAFNLVSNLIMIVNERKADIAIFRTMGASRAEILQIFLWHGFMIGLVGIAAGLIIGSLLATFITPIYGAMDRSFNLRLMDEYFIHYLPSQILVSDLVMIGGVAAFICLLAAIYPALQAARTPPAEALRYE